MAAQPRTLAFAAALLVAAAPTALAELTLAPLFGDHMVLQRGEPIAVWGEGEPGESVELELGGRRGEASVADSGVWSVRLDALPAGGPHEMVISDGAGRETVVRDVMMGDVWVCSGQSNMEWRLELTDGGAEAIAAADLPRVRLLTMRRAWSAGPRHEADTEGWSVSSPGSAAGFSAVGFHFARELNEQTGVPIGVIHAAWGGTPGEAWTPSWAIDARPGVFAGLSRRAREPEAFGANGLRAEHTPSRLYNAMIHPLTRLGISGAIWYQGESNAARAEEYGELFPAMIEAWRAAWSAGRGERVGLPFYFVQLASFRPREDEPGESDWAELREAQRLTAHRVDRTGMAVTLDVGDANDIHPRAKRPVAERLARLALRDVYGRTFWPAASPEPAGVSFREGAAVVRFEHAEGLATADGGGAVHGFALAGADGRWVWADATIEGETVRVTSPEVPRPVRLRYGWADNPRVNLVNAAGLPATPFQAAAD